MSSWGGGERSEPRQFSMTREPTTNANPQRPPKRGRLLLGLPRRIPLVGFAALTASLR
jgi:hypothetical protein